MQGGAGCKAGQDARRGRIRGRMQGGAGRGCRVCLHRHLARAAAKLRARHTRAEGAAEALGHVEGQAGLVRVAAEVAVSHCVVALVESVGVGVGVGVGVVECGCVGRGVGRGVGEGEGEGERSRRGGGERSKARLRYK